MATYFIKYPNLKEKRRTFSVHRREKGRSPTVSDPRLAAVNARYLAGEDYSTCVRLVRELVEQLRAAEAPPEPGALQDNLRVAARYLAGRSMNKLVDRFSAEREVLRAAEAFGSLLLDHSTQKQLQDHLDNHYSGAKHARLAKAANRLLAFLKKDFTLEPARVIHPEPAHILLPDFLEKVGAVEPLEHRQFLATLMATGARSGEGFAIRAVQKEFVLIQTQLDRKLVYRHTKTKNARKAVIIPELYDYVLAWSKQPAATRLAMKPLKWADIARRWFGVGAHDLRHSYAKRLCEMNLDLQVVADSLGIDPSVAKQHYIGWLQTDYQISAAARRLRGE